MVGEYRPQPGKYADKAIKVALANSTVQELFEDKEIGVASVRDFGITGSECPIDRCAMVVFGDIAGDMRSEKLYAITVNTLSEKVVNIAPSTDILIDKTSQIEEVKYFVSKYSDAEITVNRYPPDHVEVRYRVERAVFVPEEIRYWPDTHSLSLWIEIAASTGKTKNVYAECGSVMTERATANIIEYIESTDCLNPNWDNVDYGPHD